MRKWPRIHSLIPPLCFQQAALADHSGKDIASLNADPNKHRQSFQGYQISMCCARHAWLITRNSYARPPFQCTHSYLTIYLRGCQHHSWLASMHQIDATRGQEPEVNWRAARSIVFACWSSANNLAAQYIFQVCDSHSSASAHAPGCSIYLDGCSDSSKRT